MLQALGIPARPGSLAELALTHRSFAFEQPETTPHNERLEFLGDAVLQGIVTEFIYRSYPDLPEGEMARLRASVVEKRTLAIVARDVGLGHHLRLGKGEEASGGRDKSSLLADALEALIGAAFIERNGRFLAEVLVPVFAELIAEVVAAGGGQDPKGAFAGEGRTRPRPASELPGLVRGPRSRQTLHGSSVGGWRGDRRRGGPEQEGS